MSRAIDDNFIEQMSTPFLPRNDNYLRWGSVVSSYLMLPGIRGFWPASGLGPGTDTATVGALMDLVGGNHMALNGTPTLGYENLIPYRNYNGSTQYYSITDAVSNNAFDIIGTEGTVVSAVRGMSLGCWVRFDNAASGAEICIGKAGASGAIAYRLFRQADGTIRNQVSVDGTAVTNVDSVDTVGANVWTFIAGTFDPSTEMKVWINDTSWSNTTSIPASIFNTATVFTIGANGTATFFVDGQMNKHWITATLLSDSIIKALFEQSRVLYGV